MALSISCGVHFTLAVATPRGRLVRASAASSPPGDETPKQRRVRDSLRKISLALNTLSEAVQHLADALIDEEEQNKTPGGESEVPVSRGLAFTLQQSFLQMRIKDLGKPFELATDDFVSACMQARSSGIPMDELQLQLILADGSLSGAFASKTDDSNASYFSDEEARIRAAWVRYVYVALSEADAVTQEKTVFPSQETGAGQVEDPADRFVKQVIKDSLEEEYTLTRLKMEQELSGTDSSPSVQTLRQSNFLILLAFEKAKSL